jgi:hypothetical protein
MVFVKGGAAAGLVFSTPWQAHVILQIGFIGVIWRFTLLSMSMFNSMSNTKT